MQARGLSSLFPIADVAVMGLGSVVRHLPRIYRRVQQTVASVLAARPDALVIIDSPGFTHSVARRVVRARPELPVVGYVSPSVWAWRPGRAPRMAAYVDHLLALLPFEPAVHERLGGPPCTYVGHPLIERLDDLRAAAR
jgi:lipid-A-disaccharide synthase